MAVAERPKEPCECGETAEKFRLLDCGVWFCDHCGNPQNDHPDGGPCWAGAA